MMRKRNNAGWYWGRRLGSKRSRVRRKQRKFSYDAGALRRSLRNAREGRRLAERLCGVARHRRAVAEAALGRSRRDLRALRARVRVWRAEVEEWGETRLVADMDRALARQRRKH